MSDMQKIEELLSTTVSFLSPNKHGF